MPEDPITRELQIEQSQREVREREQARESTEEPETKQHERRAERAAYLKGKLDERAKSEEDEPA